MIFAYYYTWYNTPHDWEWFSQTLTDIPLIGKYWSYDPKVIEHHILKAKEYGIDGFLVSWKYEEGAHGRNNILRNILDLANSYSFKIGIITEFKGKSLEERDRQLEWLLAQGEINKPFIVSWAMHDFTPEQWKPILEKYRDKAIFLACGYYAHDRTYLPIFDGLAPYTAFEHREDFDECARLCRETNKIWMPCFLAGFYDKHIPNRSGLFIPRNKGLTLKERYEIAKNTNPDYMALISWNEYPECTYLEPTEYYGDWYLRALNNLVNGLDLPSNPPEDYVFPKKGFDWLQTIAIAGCALGGIYALKKIVDAVKEWWDE